MSERESARRNLRHSRSEPGRAAAHRCSTWLIAALLLACSDDPEPVLRRIEIPADHSIKPCVYAGWCFLDGKLRYSAACPGWVETDRFRMPIGACQP